MARETSTHRTGWAGWRHAIAEDRLPSSPVSQPRCDSSQHSMPASGNSELSTASRVKKWGPPQLALTQRSLENLAC